MKPSRNIKAEDYRDDSSGALFTVINFGDEKNNTGSCLSNAAKIMRDNSPL